ncbi:MAG: hypothetical protein V1744_01995 [Candidatus Altiarchaeota archaeon]
MDCWDSTFYMYMFLMSAFLLYTLTPGVWVTDEAAYVLMVKSLAVDHQLQIWNGFDEIQSPELWLPSTQLVSDGREIRVFGIPAPLYTFFAVPFYLIFGVVGLNLMNVIAYSCSILVFYWTCCLFLSKGESVLSSILYSLTYYLSYSQMLWPHCFSALLVLSSVYLLLRVYLGKDSGPHMLFFSGLLSGLAVGVRYTNGMFTAVEVLFIYIMLRGRMMPYLSGLLIPAVALAYLNLTSFGSVVETSYPSHVVWYILALAVPLLAAIVFAVHRVKAGSKPSSGHIKSSVVILAFVLLLLCFFEPTKLILIKLYAKVFDMALMPDYPGLYKKALLQSVPYLILAVLGPYFMLKRRFNVPLVALLTSFALAEVALSPFISAGGWDETYSMRYFLESLPFLVLFAAYSMGVLLRSLSRMELVFSAIVFLVFAAYLLSSGENIYLSDGLIRNIPMLIYVVLLVSASAYLKFTQVRPILLLFLILSVSYAASIAYADLHVMEVVKGTVWGTSVQVAEQVPNDSVIIFSKKGEYPYLATVKLSKRVRLVTSFIDEGGDLPNLMRHYSDRGIPIYINNMNGILWRNVTSNFVVENNMSNVYFLEYKAPMLLPE